MKKEEFLQMLQKTEIRREILRIVKEGQSYISNIVYSKEDVDNCKSNRKTIPAVSDISNFSQNEGSSEKEKNRILETENNRLRVKIDEMRNKLQQVLRTYLRVIPVVWIETVAYNSISKKTSRFPVGERLVGLVRT